MYQKYGKRAFDLVLIIVALPVLLPVCLIVAFLVRILLGKGIIFRQRRPGLHGKPFHLLKFRTMTNAVDEQGKLLPDSMRLTAFGRFLRSTSLDELPELLNILMGEMSLVGPRPLLMHYLELYTPEQRRRHNVMPGITGWAQVNGRNELTWDEKFARDIWYVEHYSLWLDIKIIALTFLKVIRREGISQPGQATMQEFKGNGEIWAK